MTVKPYGVFLTDAGVDVRLFSTNATAAEFCVFDDKDLEHKFALQRQGEDDFVGSFKGLKAGQRYGFRMQGPWDAQAGHFFDPAKLVVDPLVRAVDGVFRQHKDLGVRGKDTARLSPRGIITRALESVPQRDTHRPEFIYEVHVRNFTKLHPDVPEAQRGMLAAMAHPAIIAHMKKIGVDTVEFMPLMAWADEAHLAPLGLTNAWGYNPYVFGAPEPRLVPGGWAEVRSTFQALRAAGFQIILDVVFNHSGEGGPGGPVLSFRGLDNASYYAWKDGLAINDSGCGNTFCTQNCGMIATILAAQKLWIEAGCDGFRYDLATVLGRLPGGYSKDAPLFKAMEEDPIVSRALHIAEPWDIGPGGYQLGNFPAEFQEWNGKYRDDVRGFWRGDGSPAAFVTRLSGSADLFQHDGRAPSASINFLAAHDGFTLGDVARYTEKNNQANGENNRDGNSSEISWASAEPARDVKAMIATLFYSKGTVMLTAGDEMGRTQHGNNNAYCQDTSLSWVDWLKADKQLIEFTANVVKQKSAFKAYYTDQFLSGQPVDGRGFPDVEWRCADGVLQNWNTHHDLIGMVLSSEEQPERVAIYFNRSHADLDLKLPEPQPGLVWDTAVQRCSARAVHVFREKDDKPYRATQADEVDVKAVASAAGIQSQWWEIDGTHHAVTLDTQRALLTAMGLDIHTRGDAVDALWALQSVRDIPDAEPVHADRTLEQGRVFGLAAHLYALRHQGDWGIGDFGTLRETVDVAGGMKAAMLGLNPLHHMFTDNRNRISPYQPSDRRFIDPIYIDVEALGSAKPAEIVALNALDHVDYPRVWALKDKALREQFHKFTGASSYDAFVKERGMALQDHARYESRHDASRFHYALWLQWIADSQLGEAAKGRSSSGLACGIYNDMAIGCAADGGEVWARPGLYCPTVSLGAPPDPFAAQGQVWGLPPFNPLALAKTHYEPYAEILSANMRHAGVLRIDHVLGLARQFWVPNGASGQEGAYVSMPVNRLLSIAAAESHKAQCAIIGEDLGTVPEGFRDKLWAHKLMSYRVLWFEREGHRFLPPDHYPRASAVCLSSHDLMPFAGWAARAPEDDKQALSEALQQANCFSGDMLADAHQFIGSTPAMITLVQADDISEETDPLNVPGTYLEMPNWRRRLKATSAELPHLSGWQRIARGLQRAGRLA